MAFIIVFIAFLDNMAQQPLISPMAEFLGASNLMAGLIFGAYSIANIFGNLLSPTLVGKKGLKVTLTGAFIGVGTMLFLYSIVQTPSQMLLVRMGHGVAGGIVVPCVFSYISYGKQYCVGMSKVGRVIGTAAILGPGLAGVLSGRFGYQIPFLGLSMLYFAAIPLLFRLPDRRESLETLGAFGSVWVKDGLRIAYASAFTIMFSMGTLGFWFPLRMMTIGFTAKETGISFLLFGLAAILVMRVGAMRAGKNPLPVIASGFFLIFAAITLLSMVQLLPLVFLSLVVFGLGFGLVFPSMNILVVQETSAAERTSAFAVFHGFFSLAVFAAGLLCGLVQTFIDPYYLILVVILLASGACLPLGRRYTSGSPNATKAP